MMLRAFSCIMHNTCYMLCGLLTINLIKMSRETSTKQLTEILVQAIREEPYFSKEVLIPKVRAIISGFRLRLATINYNAIKNPSETAKLIRSNELHNLEKDFWKQELKKVVGSEKMNEYYSKLDEQRLVWNGTEHCI